MALTPPYPNSPTNGDALDANPVRANLQAIYAAIQSFDASQIQSKTVVEAALADAINPRLRGSETIAGFVASGLAWSAGAGLLASMTSGVLYYNGYRTPVNAVSNHTFTASKDTYVDIDYLGNIYYSEVTNNSSSPSLTANSVRVAIVVTNGSAVTSVNQGDPTAVLPIVSSVAYAVTDSLGNIIYPTSPNPGLIGYRQITSSSQTFTGTIADITGLDSVPCIVPAGRRVKITAMASANSSAGVVANEIIEWTIREGSTTLGTADMYNPGGGENTSTEFSCRKSPTSGLHTYKLSGKRAAGSGTIAIGTNSTSPLFVSVELV